MSRTGMLYETETSVLPSLWLSPFYVVRFSGTSEYSFFVFMAVQVTAKKHIDHTVMKRMW